MMDNNNKNAYVRQVAEQKYEFGFTTDVHTDIIEKGLSEDVVRLISVKKGEPEWLLAFRLQAFRYWQKLKQPSWGHVRLPEIDYQAISYYADPLAKKPKNKEIDPEMEKTFEKLGIPLEERLALSGTAVDAIMDSVSVKTTFKEKLIPTWYANTWEQSFFIVTISSQRSTVRCLATVRLYIFPRVFVARWNSVHISASMQEIPVSSSVHSLWPKITRM